MIRNTIRNLIKLKRILLLATFGLIVTNTMGQSVSEGLKKRASELVANNVEINRMYINSAVHTRTLNEIYLTPFK